MTASELSSFCLAADDCALALGQPQVRSQIDTPWSWGRHSYATNGRVMIRVSVIETVPMRANSPNVARLWSNHFVPAAAVARFVAVELPPQPEKDAFGYFPIKLGERIVNWDYLEKLVRLPLLRMAIGWGDVHDPLAFRFTNGEGMIMPMRASEEAKRRKVAA